MAIVPLLPPGLAKPIAPYSMGSKAFDTIYVSGIVALNAEGKTVGPGDAAAQTRFILETISAVLKAGGATLKDIAFNTIILRDMKDYAAMNKVYAEFFPTDPPARYCIGTILVRDDFLVEIASIAHVSNN